MVSCASFLFHRNTCPYAPCSFPFPGWILQAGRRPSHSPERRRHQYRKVQKGNPFIIINDLLKGGNACDVYSDTGEITEQRDCDILHLLPGSGLDGRGQLSRKHAHMQPVGYSGSVIPRDIGSCCPIYNLLIRREGVTPSYGLSTGMPRLPSSCSLMMAGNAASTISSLSTSSMPSPRKSHGTAFCRIPPGV